MAAPRGAERALPPAGEVLATWGVRCVSVRPFGAGWWSFNPCVHYDRQSKIWRCVFRVANYSLPGGVPQLSPDARAGRAQTRNVVATLDPATLELADLREVRELDGLPRARGCSSLGYEDVRLFRTARDGLCGVATALQLNLDRPSCPEVVLVKLSDAMDVVQATPLRGPWSGLPQKNWSPFDGADEPRFLYSIERGVVMGDAGPIEGQPVKMERRRPTGVVMQNVGRCGVEVKVTRPAAPQSSQTGATAPPPGSTELRGGSQLTQVEPGVWLGVAHEMKLSHPERRKFYWHTLYTCDGRGRLLERSKPFKLSPDHGIEFAAGLAVDDRGGVAISFGTDDHDSWVGVTTLDSVRRALRPVRWNDGPTVDV